MTILMVDYKPFVDCNMCCSFCHEKKLRFRQTEKVTLDLIKNRNRQFLQSLKESIKTIKPNKIKMSFMGGELFQDKFSDDITCEYQVLFEAIKTLGISTEIVLITNLQYKKIERLLSLIDFLKTFADISVQVSFDLHGRFTKEKQIERFFENLYKLPKENTQISMVLHRVAIVTIIQNVPNKMLGLFKRLYNEGFEILTIQYYNNIKSTPYYEVSEKDIVDCYHYLIDHYPNLPEIKHLIHRATSHETVIKVPQKVFSLSVICGKIKLRDYSEKENNFLNSHCLTCEHNDYCYTGTIQNKDTVNQYANVQCFDRELFQYIQKSV